MYARSTTIHALPDRIDRGVTYVREVIAPAIPDFNGCLGMSLLVDREGGRCIATTSWQTREQMRASAEAVKSLRDTASQLFGGPALVEEWEIAALHRVQHTTDAACVRATWFQLDPDQLERGLDVYKFATLPAMAEIEGFCSASLMIDPETGRCVSCATYQNRATMQRSRLQANTIRSTGIEEVNATVLDVCEFELVLAHLHVPELV